MTINNNTIKFEICQDQKELKDIKFKFQKSVYQGSVIDMTKISFSPRATIKKISKNQYIKLNVPVTDKYGNVQSYTSDGEVYQMNPVEKRDGKQMRNRRSLRKIFVDLRQIIQTNFGDNNGQNPNTQFLTLTYEGKKQTNNHKQIHNDFKKFWERLKYKYNAYDLGYIAIVEPHASGMFHIHVLLKSLNCSELKLKGSEIYDVWRNGYTTVEDIRSNHIGAYFIAYFSNLEILPEDEIAELEKQGDITEKNGKKYIKGKRLDMYPDGMQIYRYSRNMSKPKVIKGVQIIDENAYNKTYDTTFKLTSTNEDGEEKDLYINKQQYKDKK